jgi:hypothetical protein
MVHFPLYCASRNEKENHCNEYPEDIKESLLKLMNKYKVDLVLSGHLHDYERIQPMVSGKPGTMHVICGAAGTRFDNPGYEEIGKLDLIEKRFYIMGPTGYCSINITQKKLTLNFIAQSHKGENKEWESKDEFTLEK